jgi:hypothetical protein
VYVDENESVADAETEVRRSEGPEDEKARLAAGEAKRDYRYSRSQPNHWKQKQRIDLLTCSGRIQRLGRPRQGLVDDEAYRPRKEVIFLMTTSIAVAVGRIAEIGAARLLHCYHAAPGRC